MSPEPWPLLVNILVFAAATGVIAFAGWWLAGAADAIADRTGMGEALTGAVLLGASTSLPGVTASVAAAAAGHPELAISNALGGIAAQTMFLAIADLVHREANLEHAAASPTNILQTALLIALLAATLLAMSGPNIAIFGVHPITPLLFIGYLLGVRIARHTRLHPMWRPRRTEATREDVPQSASFEGPSTPVLFLQFFLLAALVGVAGWLVARAGIGLSRQTGLNESIVGALFTAVSTSLPELLTSIAAVKQGALTLAVGNVMGGNAFDTLFAAVADIAYREGSIYHAASTREAFICALGILLAGVLAMGLVRRERSGIANIGFESFLILLIYLLGMAALAFM
jgi:cation:H+ antiporter